jgi:Heavy metal binding domain
MFMTIISATSVAVGRFCSLFAIASCASTTLDIPPGHPADVSAEAAAPPRELLLAQAGLSVPDAVPAPALASTAHHHHQGHDHATTGAPTAAPDAREGKDPVGPSWTCPMHPEVVRSEAGSCPICGMHLVQKKVPPPGGKQ